MGPLEGVGLLGCLSLLEFAEPASAPAPFLILRPQVKPFLTVLLRKVTSRTWGRLDAGLSVLNPRDGEGRLTGSPSAQPPPRPLKGAEQCGPRQPGHQET